jgi:hypothetical protein
MNKRLFLKTTDMTEPKQSLNGQLHKSRWFF